MYEKLNVKYNVFSEAFPPDEKGERGNLLSYSSYHHLLNGVKIKPEKIIYKPLSKNNFLEVKNLHKEWFPIDYDDEFYYEVLNNNGNRYFTIGAFYNLKYENTNKEIILGLAFCEYEYVIDRLNKFIEPKILDDIYNDLSINYFKSFMKCQFYKCIYVMTIGVLDEFRQMHIGTKILNHIYKIALKIDFCIGVYLHVINYNDIAIKFYQKNKFKKVGKVDNYYFINGKNYDSLVFFKIIPKNEKDEYMNTIKISKNINNENKNLEKNRYKNKNIIKVIILIILIIFNILMGYKGTKIHKL